jgi:AAA domain-containing protein
MSPLAVCRAQALAVWPEERHWLIEGLWADQAVGIVGGEPKCGKSFLALDLAVAVASGAPCLRRFRPAQTGRVLLFAAEDALHVVRRRLEGIARAAAVAFDSLDIHVITTPVVRLDLDADRRRLLDTVAAFRPTLLVLDPFARLHGIDENAAADVAPLLAYLRQLQRDFATAVVLVHHTRKGAAHLRPGQALRGSSELHAWGDSNLYVQRRGDTLRLTVEHRAAPSTNGLALELRACGDALALHVVDLSSDALRTPVAPSPIERIEEALAQAALPLSLRQLRRICRMRTATLCDALTTLRTEGRVLKSPAGYWLAPR